MRSRHCPATVSGDLCRLHDATAPQRGWEGATEWQYLASQETGSTKPMSALSGAKEDRCALPLGSWLGLPHL